MNTPQTDNFLHNTDIAKDTLVLILAGGRGSRLHEMTDERAKPAVYFGGNWRIIDFTLSNCLNSNLLRIGVITQYEAHSLLRHLQHAWSFLPRERGQFVDMLPARQSVNEEMWYRGTADAVWQNMNIMKNHYHIFKVVRVAQSVALKSKKKMPKNSASCRSMINGKYKHSWKNHKTHPPCAKNPIHLWHLWGFMYLIPITYTMC